MDIFKLLARSTNLQKSTSLSKNAAHPQIPSAGFHRRSTIDEEMILDAEKLPTMNGRKRKRREPKEQEVHTPSHLDFFKRDYEDGALDTMSAAAEINNNENNLTEDEPKKIGESASSLAVEDCSRILKRHKLKVTLLNSELDAAITQTGSNHGKSVLKQLTIQPLASFKQLRARYGISRRLAENIQEQGYFEPTEVQMGSLPILLGSDEDRGLYQSAEKSQGGSKRLHVDLLTIAPTGSGKTLAFLIYVFHGLITELAVSKKVNASTEREHRVQALIIAPTHELADQIANEGRKLAMGTGLKVAVMRKGMKLTLDERGADKNSTEKRNDKFANEDQNGRQQPLVKVDILVSTPMVLVHAITPTSNLEPIPLPEIRYLVLDEADILLDPLFRSQTLGIWNACVHPSLQTSLWSATIGASIETLAQTFILDRRRSLNISAPEISPHHIIRLVVGLKDSAIPNVSHRLIYAATEQGKLLALRQILHPTTSSSEGSLSIQPPFLVFTQTIPRAIALHAELMYDISPEAGGSSRLAVLHSDLSTATRSAIMANFRKGEIWVLITTDLLSRGVDFRGVNGVVNYDIPTTGASYIHRAGRTGRQGRQGGVAVTLYTKEDIPYVRNVANAIAASENVHTRNSSNIKNNNSSNTPTSKWLLEFLPHVSKKTKKELKLRGVASRRVVDLASSALAADAGNDKGKSTKVSRISTKSGYQRKLENRKRDMARSNNSKIFHVAATAAERRKENCDDKQGKDADGGEWGGIED